MEYEYAENYQTKTRGRLDDEYEIYRNCANNGKGGDLTRGGAPLKTFEEWLNS
jgi:hypothetical protein